MTGWQQIAIECPALIAEECAHPRYTHRLRNGSSLVLTVNAGYE
jgi:hypothetical protein